MLKASKGTQSPPQRPEDADDCWRLQPRRLQSRYVRGTRALALQHGCMQTQFMHLCGVAFSASRGELNTYPFYELVYVNRLKSILTIFFLTENSKLAGNLMI